MRLLFKVKPVDTVEDGLSNCKVTLSVLKDRQQDSETILVDLEMAIEILIISRYGFLKDYSVSRDNITTILHKMIKIISLIGHTVLDYNPTVVRDKKVRTTIYCMFLEHNCVTCWTTERMTLDLNLQVILLSSRGNKLKEKALGSQTY